MKAKNVDHDHSEGHSIIVIGASAGGLEALRQIIPEFPSDLDAAIFVVVHVAPGYASLLPEIFAREGHLPAAHPLHGEVIERGRIYVAPPDNHLMVRPGYVQVVRSAKENGHRPAVDALFRSAAIAYGPRVIGVVLSGHQDCGTAGLISIKSRGGIAMVQDPDQAVVPDMPRSAIAHAHVDYVARLNEIASLLVRLSKEPIAVSPKHLPRPVSELEGEELGVSAEIVCPSCSGRMTVAEVGGFQLFRCHTGHAFSLQNLVTEHAEAIERSLWAAVRALEEGAAVAHRASKHVPNDVRRHLQEKEEAQFQQAQVIRGLLLEGRAFTETDSLAEEQERVK